MRLYIVNTIALLWEHLPFSRDAMRVVHLCELNGERGWLHSSALNSVAAAHCTTKSITNGTKLCERFN